MSLSSLTHTKMMDPHTVITAKVLNEQVELTHEGNSSVWAGPREEQGCSSSGPEQGPGPQSRGPGPQSRAPGSH